VRHRECASEIAVHVWCIGAFTLNLLLGILALYWHNNTARKSNYPPTSRAIWLAGGRKHSKGVQDRALWAFLGGENKSTTMVIVCIVRV
jgi:hypothetical protein